MDGYTFTAEPPRAVTDYLALKSLEPQFSWLEALPEEHAFNFHVAKAMEMDVLSTIRDSLQAALEDGTPFEAWKRDLEPELQRLGWWGRKVVEDRDGNPVEAQLGSPRRLRTIWWANTRNARVAGQWERIQRNKAALPFLIYTLGPSENHRPLHVEQEGTIASVDSAYWTTWMGPNGWGCKCGARQISRAEAERRGYAGEDPEPGPTETFVNSLTGQQRSVPVGIDPGWETNPGITRRSTVAALMASRIDRMDRRDADLVMRTLLLDDEVLETIAGRRPNAPPMPIAVLPDPMREALGVDVRTVTMSQATARTHSDPRKGNPPPERWLGIHELLDHPDARVFVTRPGTRDDATGARRLLITVEEGEEWHRIVVKRDGPGAALFVLSYKIRSREPNANPDTFVPVP